MNFYKQTDGGNYDSRPRAEHIIALLSDDRSWEAYYLDRGHGEYIDNVYALAAALKDLPFEEFDRICSELEPAYK